MKISFIHIYFITLWMIIGSGCANEPGSTFYLSSKGDDSFDGSLEKPWKTIERLNKEPLKPGDRICFEGGTLFPGTILIDSIDISLSPEKFIICSYGKGKAIIDGGDKPGLDIKNAGNFEIRNLIIKGNGRKDGNNSNGVIVSGCADFIIDSIEVYGFRHSGIHISDCKNVKITNITAHDNGFAGIHVTSVKANHPSDYGNENIYIGYSIAFNNPGDPDVTDNHSGNGILVSSARGGIIEFCEAWNNGWDMPWTGNGPVGIWIWDCRDFIIQYCISHDNKTNPVAKDGGGFDLDGGVSNSVIQYCISYNNQGAGYGLFEFGAAKPWENNIVRYNISYNDGLLNEGSLAIWKSQYAGSMRNCEIYNNTFINDTLKGIAVSLISNCPGFRFTNNIFLYRGTFITEDQKFSDEKFISNCFWNTASKMILPAEIIKDNIIIDPCIKLPARVNFTNPLIFRQKSQTAFSPEPHSPLIDRGVSVPPPFGLPFPGIDIAGTTVPQGKDTDIGALEFKNL